MLSSLLSLYIASVIGPNFLGQVVFDDQSPAEIVNSAIGKLSGLSEANSIPTKDPLHIAPIIKSKSSIAIDLKTGVILYEDNSHEELPIASITKLMTIMIIMEENDLNSIAKISANAASTSGSTMFLRTGEEITLENLMYGAIIHSANDAATALAEYNSGTVDKFVEKMNDKATKMGLLNTHFSNPVGLDSSNNYSSAYDLSKLAKYIYQKQFIKKAALVKSMEVLSTDKKYTHKLLSTNDLLGNDETGYKFKGLKTGSTDSAGQCLVAIVEDENGNEILTVLLNSPSRFTETKILADWVYRAYNWQN